MRLTAPAPGSGDTIVECVSVTESVVAPQMRYDCPAGTTCLAMPAVVPDGPSAAACSWNMKADASCTPGYACSGNTLSVCYSGLSATVDCAAFDMTCGPGGYDGKTPSCLPAGECVGRTGPGQPADAYADACDGTTMKTCMNGRIISIDCAKLGKGGTCALAGTLAGDKRAICQ